jgi:hypothetical protein
MERVGVKPSDWPRSWVGIIVGIGIGFLAIELFGPFDGGVWTTIPVIFAAAIAAGRKRARDDLKASNRNREGREEGPGATPT